MSQIFHWIKSLLPFTMRQLTPQERENMATLVTKLIKAHPVMIFSKSYCPYCIKAKAALTSQQKEFNAIELDQEADGEAIQSFLLEHTGQKTVPNIFIKGKHIGGCSDLLNSIDKGKFNSLFQ